MNSFKAFDSDSESETVEVTKGVNKVFTQNSKRVKRKERNRIKKATYSIPSRFVGRFIGKKHENRLELLDAIAQDTGCQGWSLNCMSSRLSCNGEFLFLAAEKSTVAQIQRALEIIRTSIDALVNGTTYAASEASDVSDASTIAFEPLKTKKKKKTSKKKTSKKKTSKKKTSINKKNVKNHLHKPTPLKPLNTIASWADAADEDDTADDEENPNQENPNQENPNQENYHFPAL